MSEFTKALDFQVIQPKCCGAPFAMSHAHYNQRKKDRKTWWCPSCGTMMHFTGETREEKLERQLMNEEEKRQRAQEQAAAVNRQYRRIRDRVKNGACPCCNRWFPNLAAHMRTKHQDFGYRDMLRALRQAYGLTQAGLAEEIWTYQTHISGYENGKPVPANAEAAIEAWLNDQIA